MDASPLGGAPVAGHLGFQRGVVMQRKAVNVRSGLLCERERLFSGVDRKCAITGPHGHRAVSL